MFPLQLSDNGPKIEKAYLSLRAVLPWGRRKARLLIRAAIAVSGNEKLNRQRDSTVRTKGMLIS